MNTVNLIVNGTSYPIGGALARLSLNDAIALKLQLGIGMKSINEGVLRMNQLPGGMASPDVYEDVELINVMRAMVWAARRAVGEKLTIDEANDFSWTDADWEVLDEDGNPATTDESPDGEDTSGSEDGADVEADPTQPPAESSDPDADTEPAPTPAKRPRGARTSKTSASKS